VAQRLGFSRWWNVLSLWCDFLATWSVLNGR
ncbi:MAG: hypothetical protein ACI9T9_002065, partial [Oleiphilaceae bacterium]